MYLIPCSWCYRSVLGWHQYSYLSKKKSYLCPEQLSVLPPLPYPLPLLPLLLPVLLHRYLTKDPDRQQAVWFSPQPFHYKSKCTRNSLFEHYTWRLSYLCNSCQFLKPAHSNIFSKNACTQHRLRRHFAMNVYMRVRTLCSECIVMFARPRAALSRDIKITVVGT